MSTLTLRSAKGTPLTNNEVDSNFSNLNSDKYESGSAIAAASLVTTGDMTIGGELTNSASTSVTAAGSTQGAATALTSTFNVVTTASADQGVSLPAATTGKVIKVINDTTQNVKVYPTTSDSINDGSANVAKDLGPAQSMELVAVSGSKWNTLQEVIIFDSTGTRIN